MKYLIVCTTWFWQHYQELPPCSKILQKTWLNVYATKIFSTQKLISTYPYMKDSTFLMLSNRTIAFKTRWMPVPSIMYILLCVPICIIPQNWKCVIYFTHIHTTSAVFQHNSIRSKEYINKLTPFKFTIELKDLSSCNS